jgi:hypothetical protein
VYLVNLEPVGANGKIDMSGNKDVNVLANRTLPVFILVTINDVQYLLKLNLTETEG